MQGRKPHSGLGRPAHFSLGALTACLLALLIPAAATQAATVAKKSTPGGVTTITITTDPNVEHDISISYDAEQSQYEISDIAPMGDETGCNYSAVPDDQIICPAANPIGAFKITTGDQDDSISLDLDGGEHADVSTGAGDDFVDGLAGRDDIDAGPGDDVIEGNGGNDKLSGGSGEDVIGGGDNDDALNGGDGNDALSGDDGADIFHGDGGADLADYVTLHSAVTVDLDGNGDDGRAGEHDNVGPDVENIRGGAGNDTLSGNDASNLITGGDGDDLIYVYDTGPDTAICGRGSDSAIVDPLDVVDKSCDKTEQGVGPGKRSFKIVISGCPGKTRNASTGCVRIACQQAQGTCSGKVTLEATVPGKRGGKARNSKRAKSKRVKIGSRAFKAPEGKTASVAVKLSKQGAKLLGGKGRLAVRATVAASDQGGVSEGDIDTVKLAAKLKKRR